jgi:hypothetical protein
MSASLSFTLPLKTRNPLNGAQGFSRSAAMGAARRRRQQRTTSATICRAHVTSAMAGLGWASGAWLPCIVTVTRVAPSTGLDPMDGLPASLKSVVDGIADAFGLKNDRDHRIQFFFDQRRGKPREYAVVVKIEWL